MKLSHPSLVAAASILSSGMAFTSPLNTFNPKTTSPLFAASPLEEVSPESSEPTTSDPYERIGITKDELAIGIDESEFLQWIGTKQDLTERFQNDNKGMDDARANEEVTKFLLDAEMVNAYIKFEKDKVLNPPDLRAEAEQNLSDPKTIATYAAWLVGGASFGYIRKEFIEPKYASGEWEEFHIQLPFQDMIKPATDVAAPAAEAVATPVAKISDSVVGAAADAVHDAITALS